MSEKRKKILFVITKSNWGGAQRYVFDLATALSRTYSVAVALGGDGRLRTLLEAQSIPVFRIAHLLRDVSLASEIHAFLSLYKVIKYEKPDVLHLNSSKVGILGGIAGRLAGVPSIVFTAHAWAWNEKRPIVSRIGIALLHWVTVLLSHRTITVSHAVYDQMARFPGTKKRMRVVHLGITPLPRIDAEQARAQCLTREPALQALTHLPWFVTIGELHPIKGHIFVLKALELLKKEGYACVYILIGDGEQYPVLQDYVTSHNLSDTVFFLGHIQDAAVLLSTFDLFILPSLSEAFGYVLLEAGAAEVPILASAVGGIPEIIGGGMGTLVPPQDPVSIADALMHRTPSAEHVATHDLKVAVATYFTKERMVTETRAVYDLS